MTAPGRAHLRAEGITRDDTAAGFRSGVHALDDYFRRHALANSEAGVGRAYVIRRTQDDDPALPAVLGYYTLSMALVAAAAVEGHLGRRLPRYPMPVALIGRLAVDERARGRRIGDAAARRNAARARRADRRRELLGSDDAARVRDDDRPRPHDAVLDA